MIVGWKEYVLLPEIQPAAIRAKLDTGALTSSLDARDIKTFWIGGAEHVEFRLAPPRSSTLEGPLCRVPVIDRRVVRNFGGARRKSNYNFVHNCAGRANNPNRVQLDPQRPDEFSSVNRSPKSGGAKCCREFYRAFGTE